MNNESHANVERKLLRSNKIVLKDEIRPGVIDIRDGRIYAIYESDFKADNVVDYGDNIIAPGLVDIHTHGFAGYSFTGVTNIHDINDLSKIYLKAGVTSLLATVSFDAIKPVIAAIDKGLIGAEILGLHLEGPFLNAKRCTAAPAGTIFPKPNPAYLKEMIKAAKGHLKMMTLAPELAGNNKVIKILKKEKILVAAGHTNVSYEKLVRLEGDIDILTHLANAMSGVHHREMGALGYGLNSDIFVELIADGRHVTKSMLEIIFKIKSLNEIILISDSIALGGCPSGDYQTYADKYIIDEKGTIINSYGSLSGSSFSLLSNLQYVYKNFDFNLSQLFKIASLNPSKFLGVDDKLGSLTKGKMADIIILDKDLNTVDVYKNGSLAYNYKDDIITLHPKLDELIKDPDFLNFYSTKAE